MGSSSSQPVSSESQLIVAKGNSRTEFLKRLVEDHEQPEANDFYELFGLDRYAEMDSENLLHLREAFRRLALRWHPDKNPDALHDRCNVWMAKISLGKTILEAPDLKRRYDLELQKQRDEIDGWSSASWWVRWGWVVLSAAGAIGLIYVGMAGATGGALFAIAGSPLPLFLSSVQGFLKMYHDPHCSDAEFIKVVAVGALAGAAGSVVCATAPVTMVGKMTVGAITGAGCQVISDATDVLISNGTLGPWLRANVTDVKRSEEACSVANMRQLMLSAAIGAAVAGVTHLAFDSPFAADVSGEVEKAAPHLASQSSSHLAHKAQAVIDKLNPVKHAVEHEIVHVAKAAEKTVRAVTKEIAKKAAKETVKAVAEETSQKLAEEAAKAVTEESSKKPAEETQKAVTREKTWKKAVEQTAKAAMQELSKPAAVQLEPTVMQEPYAHILEETVDVVLDAMLSLLEACAGVREQRRGFSNSHGRLGKVRQDSVCQERPGMNLGLVTY